MKRAQIFIKLIEARGVADKDVSVQALIFMDAEKKHKSEPSPKSTSPVWEGEKGRIWNVEDGHKELRVELKTKGMMKKFLGMVSFTFENLSDGVPYDQFFPLEGRPGKADKNVKGELHLQLMFSDRPDGSITDVDFTHPLQTLLKKQKPNEFGALLGKDTSAEFVNKANADGDTPLHFAARLDLPDQASMLLKKGAKHNVTNNQGLTPLHVAAVSSPQTTAILCDAKADVEAKDSDGDDKNKRPLHLAAAKNVAKSVAVLLDKGADINSQSDKGETPLHMALHNNSVEVLKLLCSKGADPYKKNKDGLHCCGLAMKLGGDLKNIFMDAIDVEDDREFALHDDGFTKRHRVEGDGLYYDWVKSNQYVISADKPVRAKILVHFIGTGVPLDATSRVGFALLNTTEGVHKEMSYQTNCLGFGSQDPYSHDLEPGKMYAVVPYSAEQETKGKFSLLIFTKGEDVTIKPLAEWKHHVSASGSWKGESAGGAYQNNNPWRKNPHFLLRLPTGSSPPHKCYIMLEQEKTPMDIIAFVTRPYAFHIGFYVFDKDVEEMRERSVWQNAREVYKNFSFDGKDKELVLVPCTVKPGQETNMVIHCFSDEPIELEPFKPPTVVDIQ